MSKSAMQELIDRLDKTEKQLDKENNLVMSSALYAAKSMALEYLEKEKEQIINTYEIGSSHGMGVIEDGLDYIHGIEYFDQTYNQ